MHPLIQQGSAWSLTEKGTDKEQIRQNETLFALANGHIGTRGSLEEASRTPDYSFSEGTLMNGFYDTEPITYGEWAYGYATHHQTVIPLPNGKRIEIMLDEEIFDLETGEITDHERTLDLKKGILTRSFTWNKILKVQIERFVSYDYPELLAQRIQLTPLVSDKRLAVKLALDDLAEMGTEEKTDEEMDPRTKKQKARRFDAEVLESKAAHILHATTHNTGLHALVGAVTVANDDWTRTIETDGSETASLKTEANKTVTLERFIGYSSIFHKKEEVVEERKTLELLFDVVKRLGYDQVRAKHVDTMKQFWALSDVEIDGDDALQVGLRFNIFHLNQAAGRDGKTNMSAKGLSGEGYEGHYFWDTEMYMLPFFLYTQPETAKKLLQYRHSILPQARDRARELAVDKGALFAWRTINGEEASAYYPAGTAQVHINADIAHAVYGYMQATDDEVFTYNEGLEILVETARFWLGYGHFDEQRDGAFVLNDVTGPDEYTAIVNNNFYTNLMAKHNLDYAIETVMKAIAKERGSAVLAEIGFEKEELEQWAKASEKMFYPYDKKAKLTMQDDSFFHKKVWDFDNTPAGNYPLLLNYHPLTIYRHQVCKQADTVLGQFLFSWEFSADQKARDYAYYEAVTTHDSSLSRSVFGMMASDIGDLDKAYSYFMDTALMDITDMQANTKDGVHAANMGGTWMSMVYGFAGLRVYEEALHFTPKLPKQWQRIAFTVQFKGREIGITITPKDTQFDLRAGEPLTIYYNGKAKQLINFAD